MNNIIINNNGTSNDIGKEPRVPKGGGGKRMGTVKSPNVRGRRTVNKTTPSTTQRKRSQSPKPAFGASTKGSNSSKRGGKGKRGINKSATAAIIDTRLRKDIDNLRMMKPSLHVKRTLLRGKLLRIRHSYKEGNKPYAEMMSESGKREVKRRVLGVEDVRRMMVEGTWGEREEVREEVYVRRKRVSKGEERDGWFTDYRMNNVLSNRQQLR